jgi:hypothetical protein
MGITIKISTELEDKISKRAAAEGLPVEEYAIEVLERHAAMPALRELFGPVRDEIDKKGTTDDELSAEIERAVSEVRSQRRA